MRAAKWSLGSISAKVGFGTSLACSRSEPRSFPSSGYGAVGQNHLAEEEAIPECNPDDFYPVRLGEIFNGRYQTVAKIGYGSSSTIWLARDLE